MIRSFNGKTPKIADTAFVSEFAYVVGDVEIGEKSGVWPGAVVRGDFGSIRIGQNSHIEDNAVLHAWKSLIIGDNVTVGHSAVVHCLRIGDNVLVGNNATVLDDTEMHTTISVRIFKWVNHWLNIWKSSMKNGLRQSIP